MTIFAYASDFHSVSPQNKYLFFFIFMIKGSQVYDHFTEEIND